MKQQFKSLVLMAGVAVGALVGGQAMAGNFTASYSAGLSSYSIKGTEPSDGAKHPVFIYTVGTTESWDNGQAMAAVAEMAAKGFVAAAVQYDSALFGTCSQILSKAKYIYNSASTSSAISKLCARSTADCSKGIVTAGFSQGSVIAINAKNYDTRVRAAYGMGSHNLYTTYVMNSCMNAGNYKLPKANLRIVNGENDAFPGGTTTTVRSSSQSVAGKTCSGAFECLNANGSGWIMVKNSQVGDLSADHCYQRSGGGCLALQDLLDSGWRNGTANWGLKANLNWLASFATP
jgi:predicted esterase